MKPALTGLIAVLLATRSDLQTSNIDVEGFGGIVSGFYRLQKRRRLLGLAFLQMLLVASECAAQSESAGAINKKTKRTRRVIRRATNGWKGSTLAGYLRYGDDKTYLHNFRMSRATFNDLVRLIEEGGHMGKSAPPTLRAAQSAKNLPTVYFKVAACLYFMAIGAPPRAAADVASIGVSTLHKWLKLFINAVYHDVKPKYMPDTPPDPQRLADIIDQFAARRGLPNVAMACDGSHVPFTPDRASTRNDFRNYKGWYSILVVAWVDSFYCFIEADVGWPGRSGDNTVLKQSSFLKKVMENREAWLGHGGVILGDGGASDDDNLFRNPYHAPQDADKCWYNFCHSSTRFFVEETFGRWKNRWRFLLRASHNRHDLTNHLIYTSMILHNLCTIHKGNEVKGIHPLHNAHATWLSYRKEYRAEVCPSCRRAKIKHCLHVVQNRNGTLKQEALRRPDSGYRDLVCQHLWNEFLKAPALKPQLCQLSPPKKRLTMQSIAKQ